MVASPDIFWVECGMEARTQEVHTYVIAIKRLVEEVRRLQEQIDKLADLIPNSYRSER